MTEVSGISLDTIAARDGEATEESPSTSPTALPFLADQDLNAAQPLPESLLRIPVTVQIVLGTARLPLSDVAALKPGSVVTLDQKLGTPVTILVNGKDVARGELFVLDGDGDRLGVTISELAPATTG